MKKLIILALALVLCLGLFTGCRNRGGAAPVAPEPTATTTPVVEPTRATTAPTTEATRETTMPTTEHMPGETTEHHTGVTNGTDHTEATDEMNGRMRRIPGSR